SLAVFCATRHPPRPTRFPYTTLFRSRLVARFRARLQVSRQRLLGAHARRRLLGEGAARSQPHRRRRPRAVRVRRIVFLSNAQLRSEEHTSELQSRVDLVCRLLLEKKK